MIIAFEGIDGSGKTTQAQIAFEYLSNNGLDVTLLHEPEKLGKMGVLREMILSGDYGPEATLHLFLAARQQLITEYWEKFKDPTHILLLDRYYHSTIAYQSLALPQYNGEVHHDLMAKARESTRGFLPNIVLYFDITAEESERRLAGGVNHFDRWDIFQKQRLIENYKRALELTLTNYVVIDASKSKKEVENQVLFAINSNLR